MAWSKTNACPLEKLFTKIRLGIFQRLRTGCLEHSRIPPCRYASTIYPEEVGTPVAVSEMKRCLRANNLEFENGHTCLRLRCPLCNHFRSSLLSPPKRLETLFINTMTGMFICYGCQQTGPWHIFLNLLSKMRKKLSERETFVLQAYRDVFLSAEDIHSVRQSFSRTESVAGLPEAELQDLAATFNFQGLTPQYLKAFDVRVTCCRNSLVFPLHGPEGKLTGLKYLSVPSVSQSQTDRLEPRQVTVGLFGWPRVKDHHREVVLTGTPLDAISVSQETKIPAVCLPRGATILPPEVLPLFEPFDKVTVWFGGTVQEWEAAKGFARKLGEHRCYFVRPSDTLRPLEELQGRRNLATVLRQAESVKHRAITTFHTLRQDVLEELKHSEQVTGVKWLRFPALNALLKGHRRGELTVFTGPTGSGKTTFMSEYSLDLCMQGVNTLWGSFEIPNVRLAKTMLTQFALLPLDKCVEQYDTWADKFEQLPMYFMTFHGEESVRSVLDAMSHAVYVHDIRHVVIDNVQFMLGTLEDRSQVEHFWRQDLMVGEFRKFATKNNCHITLVMHPRKERDSEELTANSISGGVKASQEADNVLILQHQRLTLRGRKYLQVSKNRFDGDIGVILLDFDKDTLSYGGKKKPKKTVGLREKRDEQKGPESKSPLDNNQRQAG